MGIFSSKKKTIVNTTVQPVFTESQIPDSIKLGVIKGILNDGDIVEYMSEQAVGSISVKADNGYTWAKNNYSRGLPVSDYDAATSSRSAVLTTIANLQHTSITPDYYKFGPLNSLHYGWQLLMDSFGYNPQTNEVVALTGQFGVPVYLADIVATYQQKTFDDAVKYADMAALEQWGPAPSAGYKPSTPAYGLGSFGQYAPQAHYEVSAAATEDYITFTFEMVLNGVVTRRGQTVSMGPFDLDADYHQVRYRRANGTIGFFTYKDGSKTYPAIDITHEIEFSNLGTYYPWLYMRIDGRNVADESLKNTAEYKESMKWAKYIGVDYLTLSNGIEADDNVDDVEQAMLIFGVNPGAKSQAELEYLFEYFNVMYLNDSAAQDNKDDILDQFDDYSRSPSKTQIIQDKVFAMAIVHSGISKQRVVGNVGDIGFLTGELISTAETVEYTRVNSDRGPQTQSATVATPGYRYRKQVTSNVYEEVIIYNPGQVYQITNKKGSAANVGDPELLIPVDRAIVRTMSFKAREELLTRAMYLVVNTKIVIKSPWYASTIFKIVLIVIVIVVTILTWGGASGIAASLATLAASSATVIAITVLTAIVKAIVISYVAKLFVKEVGPEIGLLAAVALIAYGGYSAYASTSATQATWSTNLLTVGNSLATASNNENAALMEDLQQDYSDFLEYAKGTFDSLKEKNEKLAMEGKDRNLGLDFVKYEPMIVFGETPNDLYSRTVHSGNIGTISFAAVTNFYDIALTLPKLNNVEGDFNNGDIPA